MELPVREGILGIEEEDYYSSYYDSPREGAEAHSVL